MAETTIKVELLREDEIHVSTAPSKLMETFELFRQRLLEEREKNADLNRELNSLSDALADREAELAEARKDTEKLDWLFKCQTVTLTIGKSGLQGYVLDRAAIDGAMNQAKQENR